MDTPPSTIIVGVDVLVDVDCFEANLFVSAGIMWEPE